jgi:predicted DNA-binding protein with PD1-like motif
MTIKALTISQVLELSQELQPILELFSQIDQENVSQSTMATILGNLEKAIPVLVTLSGRTYTEEQIKAMSLIELTTLVDDILEANGVRELLGLFTKISQRFQSKK